MALAVTDRSTMMSGPSPYATVIGAAGVTMLLVAFLLNLAKVLRSDGWPYLGLNAVGAALACYSSYLISFIPFVVLEGTWTAVSVVAITKKVLTRRLTETVLR